MKKSSRKIIAWLVIIAPIVIILSMVIDGYPIIVTVDNGGQRTELLSRCNNDNTFCPLDDIDCDNVVLVVGFDDIAQLPKPIVKRRVLCCSDQKTINLLKRYFMFEKGKGNMCTLTSEIFFYNGNQLQSSFEISLDEHIVGIQSGTTEWAESKYQIELINVFAEFKPYHKGLIKIPVNK